MVEEFFNKDGFVTMDGRMKKKNKNHKNHKNHYNKTFIKTKNIKR